MAKLLTLVVASGAGLGSAQLCGTLPSNAAFASSSGYAPFSAQLPSCEPCVLATCLLGAGRYARLLTGCQQQACTAASTEHLILMHSCCCSCSTSNSSVELHTQPGKAWVPERFGSLTAGSAGGQSAWGDALLQFANGSFSSFPYGMHTARWTGWSNDSVGETPGIMQKAIGAALYMLSILPCSLMSSVSAWSHIHLQLTPAGLLYLSLMCTKLASQIMLSLHIRKFWIAGVPCAWHGVTCVNGSAGYNLVLSGQELNGAALDKLQAVCMVWLPECDRMTQCPAAICAWGSAWLRHKLLLRRHSQCQLGRSVPRPLVPGPVRRSAQRPAACRLGKLAD